MKKTELGRATNKSNKISISHQARDWTTQTLEGNFETSVVVESSIYGDLDRKNCSNEWKGIENPRNEYTAQAL